MKNYILNFNGYWREEKREHIPEVSGVYLAYRCIYNPIPKTVTLKELIYIGKSLNVKKRVSEHSEAGDFHSELQQGEQLCYSIAEVNKNDLSLVENALIYAQKPRLNQQGKDSFNYQDSSFNIGGRCALLQYTSYNITNH